jgi:hypothetical protein
MNECLMSYNAEHNTVDIYFFFPSGDIKLWLVYNIRW